VAETLSIGIPCYGEQSPKWWTRLALLVNSLNYYGITLQSIHTAGSMMTDGNRNAIVADFLKAKADWLLWLDTDNVYPNGAVRRLLDTQKTLVTGLYFLKYEPFHPIAYQRAPDNRYYPIEDWRRGEILPIDMAGMGACLTHRSVYEDIAQKYVILQRFEGSTFPFWKGDIKGRLPDEYNPKKPPQVINGWYQSQVFRPNHEVKNFPFFVTEYGRTEDIVFWEMAARAGHAGFCDTSVVVKHRTDAEVDDQQYKAQIKKKKEGMQTVKDWVFIDQETIEMGPGEPQ
jgi:hypothetical protein